MVPSSEKETVVQANSHVDERQNSVYDENAKIDTFKADAIEAENAEHDMKVLEAVKAYPMASFWAVVVSCLIIMESYDVFLIGNFIGLGSFKEAYGQGPEGRKFITTNWQSGLQISGQLGALIGVCIAGPLTSRIGYRWAILIGLMLLNGFIFVFYFANTLPLMFAAQLLEGIPWGIFIANAPAYCSEIVPIQLRAPATQMLQMFWAIGSIIVGGVTYSYNKDPSSKSYRVPIALQWMFPTPLAILIYFAPESPWWLVRHGKLDQARKAVERLGRKSHTNASETVAMMRRTIELETSTKRPGYRELFKGTDLRRTMIICFVYGAQNLTGNLIANQAVFFFQQAGIDQDLSFALGLTTSALQWIAVICSWVLTTYYGRRGIYLWGSFVNCVLLIALGVAASVSYTKTSGLATASLGLIISVFFTLAAAPASYVYIGETSAIRLRPLSTGTGRAFYYIVEIPCIYLASWMLNPTTGADLGGKCGYVWGSTALICLVVAYFILPEMKDRSYREIDILFKRKTPARIWPSVIIDINDDK